MSIVAQALVFIARKAIIAGETWAGSNVKEQPVDPIGDWYRGGITPSSPLVTVYFERAEQEGTGNGADVDLLVYVYLPPSTVTLPDGTVYAADASNAGMTLNVICRQIERAVLYADNEWGNLFRRFVLNVDAIRRSTRPIIIEIEDGVRIPAMELKYGVSTMPDPKIGAALTNTWIALDTSLRGSGNSVVADIFKALIETPDSVPDYRLLQVQEGLSDAALYGVGVGPAAEGAVDDDGELPPLLTADIIPESDSD